MNISVSDQKATRLHHAFGISDDRSSSLRYIADLTMVDQPQLRTAELLRVIGEKCDTLEELAYTSFYLGCHFQFKKLFQ